MKMSDSDGPLRWRITPGHTFALTDDAAASTDQAPGDRTTTEEASWAALGKLHDMQARMQSENQRALLIVLQGVDASGKDAAISHLFRGFDPLYTRAEAFKFPTDQERGHDFLWRIHAKCPAKGHTVVFNRSHYEDVIVPSVHGQLEAAVRYERYRHINAFEELLADSETVIVKLLLHISKDEQFDRLNQRLVDTYSQWKVHPEDFSERENWDRYIQICQEMLAETSTERAPWYVVPSNCTWYRDWIVSRILIDKLGHPHAISDRGY
jgi:PPK2 family polyphosphate:nucleotide phosphotransferase